MKVTMVPRIRPTSTAPSPRVSNPCKPRPLRERLETDFEADVPAAFNALSISPLAHCARFGSRAAPRDRHEVAATAWNACAQQQADVQQIGTIAGTGSSAASTPKRPTKQKNPMTTPLAASSRPDFLRPSNRGGRCTPRAEGRPKRRPDAGACTSASSTLCRRL